jgi:Ca2+-transporting ATPase
MDWHALSAKEAIEKLSSSEQGLNKEQTEERLKQYGENKLIKTRKFNALKIFINQFKSFFIIILVLAAILSIIMKSFLDSIVIFSILLVNAGLGFFQEYKAEKAIEDLKKMMIPGAKVFRGGRIIQVSSEKIVPGDILVLREGDNVMADARILDTEGLKVIESSLTGESFPEAKVSEKLEISMPLADRVNMVYQGTQVVAGYCRAIVVDTGMNTELGKISGLVQEIKPEENPFKKKLDSFAKGLGVFILILCVILFGTLILNKTEVFKSILVTISLAISAIPEGMPAVISLCLAFATRRMLKNKVLVRKLSASETLGRVSVICTDKTGTLTEEKMEVSEIYTNGEMNPDKNKDMLLKIGILCNRARHEKDGKEGYFIGDPTEVALIISAKNNFLDKKELSEKEPRVKEFAFNSDRKMMSTIRKSENKLISYVKGAPEKIVEKCDHELINGKKVKLDDKRRQALVKVYEGMARQGLRVLGFAYKELPVFNKEIEEEAAENHLIFAGFQGMIDPPRPEVKNSIELCKQAGIKVIMLTGDSKLTAEAVAKQIGLRGKSIEARELEKMSDKELYKEIEEIVIFSRISPEDKLRIINILKEKNEIVAMTGDGVNDAPALKRADIGVAMGIRGSDVARDSAEIVLLDDNFSSIVEGVKEGRRIYDNIKKFVKLFLSVNFAEVFLVLLVMLIWKNPELLPLLPLQILWINLVTDSLPALALSVEPIEEHVMKRKPSREGILKDITGFILIVGVLSLIVDFLFFYWNISDIGRARTMVATASVIFQMFVVFNCKSSKSVFKSPRNDWLIYAVLASIGLHFLVIYTPLNILFNFVFLSIGDWLKIIGVCLIGFLIIEGYKYLEEKRRNKVKNN